MDQIEKNNERIRQSIRHQMELDFEIELKTVKLAELRQNNDNKAAALAKAETINAGLEQIAAAAQKTYENVRRTNECKISMLPQLRANQLHVKQQEDIECSRMLVAHESACEAHAAAHESRDDVVQRNQLHAELTAAKAHLNQRTTCLDELRRQTDQLRAQHALAQQNNIVEAAAVSLRLHRGQQHIAAMTASIRQLDGCRAQRQQQLDNRRVFRRQLQDRHAQLKREESQIYIGKIATPSSSSQPDKLQAKVAGPSSIIGSSVIVIPEQHNVPLTPSRSQSMQPRTLPPATLGRIDADDIATEMDQMSISQQQLSRSPRRVHFNPNDSVHAIAARGGNDTSGSESSIVPTTKTVKTVPTPSAANATGTNEIEIGGETETDPLYGMSSADSFMRDMLDENGSDANGKNGSAQSESRNIGSTSTSLSQSVRPAADCAAVEDNFDTGIFNALFENVDDAGINDISLRYDVLDDFSETTTDGRRLIVSDGSGPTPSKRAKMTSATASAAMSENGDEDEFLASQLNLSCFNFEGNQTSYGADGDLF